MKAKVFFPLLAIAALVAACVPSVNPFYTDKDVVTDPHLPGVWQEAGKKDHPSVWKFENSATNAYTLTVTEEGDKTGVFTAHLFKLSAEHFLDLIPAKCDFATNQAELVATAVIPGHLLVRVSFNESSLGLALCNRDWLEKYLEKNPQALAHRSGKNEDLVLTAETRELQKFVLQHLGKDELFGDSEEFLRQTNTVPAVMPAK